MYLGYFGSPSPRGGFAFAPRYNNSNYVPWLPGSLKMIRTAQSRRVRGLADIERAIPRGVSFFPNRFGNPNAPFYPWNVNTASLGDCGLKMYVR